MESLDSSQKFVPLYQATCRHIQYYKSGNLDVPHREDFRYVMFSAENNILMSY